MVILARLIWLILEQLTLLISISALIKGCIKVDLDLIFVICSNIYYFSFKFISLKPTNPLSVTVFGTCTKLRTFIFWSSLSYSYYYLGFNLSINNFLASAIELWLKNNFFSVWVAGNLGKLELLLLEMKLFCIIFINHL